MDKNGVKITIIETHFVTSDAASFKSVVQRLTGSSAAPATQPLRKPRPCRAAPYGSSVAGPQSCYAPSSAVSVTTAAAGVAGQAAPPCQLEELHEMRDFSELLHVGASERRHYGGGSYDGFPY